VRVPKSALPQPTPPQSPLGRKPTAPPLAEFDRKKVRKIRSGQVEIEARIVGPLVRAFAAEFGDAKTLEIVRSVIVQLAKESGAELARALGEQGLEAFANSLDRWKEGGALELEMLEQSPEHLSFNVTRCRYAELYRSLGLADLGARLSGQRDFALAEGFNPEIKLTRTQTIMEGAPFCNFRFRLEADADEPSGGPSGTPKDV